MIKRSVVSTIGILWALFQLQPVASGTQNQHPSPPKTVWTTESTGFTICVTTSDIQAMKTGASKSYAFSARSRADADWKEIIRSEEDSEEEIDCEYEVNTRVLSVVGPIMSLVESDWCYSRGAAHPSEGKQFVTVDLANHGKPIALNKIFPESTIVAALLRDPLVEEMLPYSEHKAPVTLQDLLRSIAYQQVEINDCSFTATEDLLTRFAFHHIEHGKVAVRLSLIHGAEVCRGEMAQIGILLPIPKALQESLNLAASRTAGCLMENMEGNAANKPVTFHYSRHNVK